MNLIIVESPTKARTLSKFLGKDYKIEATSGHIKDLPKSKLGIDVDHDFRPQYEPLAQKTDIINGLVGAAKKASSIYLATDPDREGEAIAQHVYEVIRDSRNEKRETRNVSRVAHHVSRIVFHEITKEAVEDAIKNPKSVDKNLVDAQVARRVLDRLVGYKLSPLLWRKIRIGLSAGRVQTVTVRLIVEKEREIEKFKSEEYWEIFVQLTVNSKQLASPTGGSTATFTVQLIKVGDKKAEIHKKGEASRIVADLEKAKYKVLNVDKHEVRKNPYPPFTTSTMTQASARIFGWSAKRTMMIAQSLYEHGHITYHRTDSTNIASVAIDKVRAYIKENYGANYLPPNVRVYKTQSKVAQEAHEAIRPTNLNFKFKDTNLKFKKEQEMLYRLVWRRFVACQMESSVYDETVIDVQSTINNLPSTTYLLRASGQMMKFDGWKKVIPSKVDVEPTQTLPEVKSEDPLQLIKVDPFQKFTEPPARYTEASLIKMLEKLGIGRPSTYAPTISTIKIRNYVEKKEGKFYPTTVGIAVNDFLMKNFPDIFEYQFTADMENDLDSIANGETPWVKPIKKFWSPFKIKLSSVTKKSKRVKIGVEKTGKKCPMCKKGELVIRIGRFGKFISCSTFPDCNYTEKYIEKAGMKCPKCKKGDVIIKKTSKGRNFFGCSRYPDCKWASWRKPENAKEKSSD